MLSTIQVDGHLEALKKAKLTVETKTSAGELNNEPTDDVDVQIRPEDDVKVEERKMTSGGKIEVEFIPQVAGQLTAQVQVNGNAVSNSPLVMDVKPQHMEEIAGDSKLKCALNTGSMDFSGIAVNKTNSRIAVADFESHCVRVFNMDGDLLLTYGSQGSGQGQLCRPHGLAFLNETDLVIADCGNHRICIVNTITGTLVKTFGCRGKGNGEFSFPHGVHVDDDCNIVVTDRGNDRVQVFTKNGEYKYQFSLSNQGGFSPWCTVTHNRLFYVSDYRNKVIDVIEMKDNSPTRISTIGGNCHAAGQLQDPWGLAIDNNHNLLVCDYGSYSVHKFTLDGRFIGKTRKLCRKPIYIAVLNDVISRAAHGHAAPRVMLKAKSGSTASAGSTINSSNNKSSSSNSNSSYNGSSSNSNSSYNGSSTNSSNNKSSSSNSNSSYNGSSTNSSNNKSSSSNSKSSYNGSSTNSSNNKSSSSNSNSSYNGSSTNSSNNKSSSSNSNSSYNGSSTNSSNNKSSSTNSSNNKSSSSNSNSSYNGSSTNSSNNKSSSSNSNSSYNGSSTNSSNNKSSSSNSNSSYNGSSTNSSNNKSSSSNSNNSYNGSSTNSSNNKSSSSNSNSSYNGSSSNSNSSYNGSSTNSSTNKSSSSNSNSSYNGSSTNSSGNCESKMAESFLTNLREDVQCSLCSDTMIEPKLVECFHTFCKACIKRNAELIGDINIFKCDKCLSETLLGELSSVDDLPPSPVHARIVQVLEFLETDQVCSVSATHSPALWHCLDCNRLLCDECLNIHSVFNKEHKVVSSSDLKNVQNLEAILTRESICKTHCSQSMDLYCKDCEVLICCICWKDGHRDHKTLTLQEVAAIQKALLSKTLDDIENLRCNAKEKKQQEEIALKIKSDGEKAKEEVQNATKKLVNILLDQEQQLLNEIQRSVAKADRNLRVIRHIPATQEYIRNILEKGLVSEMVDIQQEDSSNKCTYSPFKRESSRIVFDPNKELSEQVNAGLGKVRLRCKSDPMLSTIQVDGHLEVLKKVKLTVETKTSAGELNNEPTDDVDVQIRPEDDVKVEERKMRSCGKIQVEFIPQVAGQLTAQVQVNGNAVSNSPLVMDVKPQHMEEIAGDSKLKSALNTGSRNFTGIAVNKTNSRIAVADWKSHCVRVFNMDGDLLLTYGSQGSGQGQLCRPQGLAFLNETDLVIADCCNHRICIVNTITGTLVKTFGCYGNGNGQFYIPYGVHVDDDCNIVVADQGNYRVQVFTKNGEYKYQFSLSNQGGFSPWCSVTHNGLFYVSDGSKNVIHVIEMKDNSPTIISTIGGNCHASCQLQNPLGLAIDNNHNLLSCDADSYSVHKLTLDGRFIGKTRKLRKQSSTFKLSFN
ncbi:hypothetical protein QZH41_011427 [Actinostola sp. cb2023]|nr:hypothetical protein QZH41_011427 [Actinostola sp. cb2023]